MKEMPLPLEPFRCTCQGSRPTLVDFGEGKLIGLMGLPQILEHYKAQGRVSSPELGEELLAAIKVHNYVPDSSAELYKAVLLREYAAYVAKP